MSNKNPVSLKDFLNCFELETYMEIYKDSNAYDNFVCAGRIKQFTQNIKLFNQYSNYNVEPSFVDVKHNFGDFNNDIVMTIIIVNPFDK